MNNYSSAMASSIRDISRVVASPGVIGDKGDKEAKDASSFTLCKSSASFSLFGGESMHSECASESNMSSCSLFSGFGSGIFGFSSPTQSGYIASGAITEEEQSSDDTGLQMQKQLFHHPQKNAFILDLGVPVLHVEQPQLGTAGDGSENRQMKRCGRPDGKFPLCTVGRCTHKEHWSRLRGKRGHAYFFCRFCGLGWRVPRPKSPAESIGDMAGLGDDRDDLDSTLGSFTTCPSAGDLKCPSQPHFGDMQPSAVAEPFLCPLISTSGSS